LSHELEERSTSVQHDALVMALLVAIGDTAFQEKRGQAFSKSAPTGSFIECWERFGVKVFGLDTNGSWTQLPIAESQSRVVAWRLSPTPKELTQRIDRMRTEILMAEEALNAHDEPLLCAILCSKGRAWIESSTQDVALELLSKICDSFPTKHLAHLWCHYLRSVACLLNGLPQDLETFSPEFIRQSDGIGLGLLFRAERMEFCRKLGYIDEAVEIANALLQALPTSNQKRQTPIEHYVIGTSYFLLNNVLRHGGLFAFANDCLDHSQNFYLPGIESHDTELAHCFYAKTVCAAMTGLTTVLDVEQVSDRLFANALAELSYAHIAWSVGELERAQTHISAAARQFEVDGFSRYADKSRTLGMLLDWWRCFESKQPLERGCLAAVCETVWPAMGDQDSNKLTSNNAEGERWHNWLASSTGSCFA
jgi:tetratricopeptide (TPR) repeat protein